EVIGDAPFAALLPDVLVDSYGVDGPCDLARMAQAFSARNAAQVMVEPVPMERVNQYGVVDLQGAELAPGQSSAMRGVVEKPAPDVAPSNLSVVGRYVLPARIFDLLA